MKLIVRSDGTLTCGEKTFRCALGRGGVGQKEKEGDGVTPVGVFPLRKVFYRSDRLPHPQTNLPVQAIEENDGWCDDPEEPAYNRQIKKPFSGSHEEMWRADHLYDLVVVVGYNDSPVVPGKGSAIFMHIAKPDFAPTEGCLALKREDLEEILSQVGVNAELEIQAP